MGLAGALVSQVRASSIPLSHAPNIVGNPGEIQNNWESSGSAAFSDDFGIVGIR